ncbi:hypothetical protein DLM45_14485 [Hyphomicrobium methylovorum]|uniref:hypothetical protein n=1 Tax=Hyphomicrobium methylovorum TaxID=84 RepID=UPI0015E7A754|nr:hypothetical protein [Hyphomicrobium methylovorum]MBA2127418.1 hypothetical protein [Hyphomicrobium methylovorum]
MPVFFRSIVFAFFSFVVAGQASATDQNINLTATVAAFCTIEGSLSPSADSATVPAPGGIVDSTAIVKSYAVICNASADVTLTSINGRMTTVAGAITGFDNFIDYTAGAGGFVTIAPSSTAVGPLGTKVLGTTSTSGAKAGSLTVTITPITAQPLVAGAYADTLRVSIVPQI